jgi:hypothetical protein
MAEGEKTLEERIRHRAYELWEQAGRPPGQSEKYWQQARAELEADVSRDQQAPQAEAERRARGMLARLRAALRGE